MTAIRPVRMKDRPLLSYQQSSYTSRMGALSAQTLAYRASNNRPVRQPRPRRLDNRNSIALITTSNPFRGESLFASTEQPVYRLSPPS